jgi:integrase
MSRRAGKLSRDAVKTLKAGEAITEGGITVGGLANGDARWTVNVMISGRRVHRVIGRASEGVDRAACLAFIERVRTEERDGRLQLPSGRKTWLSFEQVAERYLQRMEVGGGRNLRSKSQHLNQWLVPYFGNQRCDTLTAFTVDTYKRKRLKGAEQPSAQEGGAKAKPKPGASPGTVNRELATLKHMLRDAVKAKDLRAVPCTFDMLPEPKGRTTILSNAEADALMAGAIGDQDPDTWLFVAFGLNTAMRHREILRARFDEIDWSRGRLHIGKAKAGGREQPLTPALVAILKKERQQRADQSGYIFQPRGPVKHAEGWRRTMQRSFRRAVVRAGLDPARITPHVMRHTAITRLVEAGIDLPTIQRISGHKTLAMVLRYAHVSGAHIDAAMAALDRTIPELAAEDRNGTQTQVTQELHKRGLEPPLARRNR